MIAGVYGILGAIVAMDGVAVGMLVKQDNKIERIGKQLENNQKEY